MWKLKSLRNKFYDENQAATKNYLPPEIKEIFDFIYVDELPVEEPDLVNSLCLNFLFPMIT